MSSADADELVTVCALDQLFKRCDPRTAAPPLVLLAVGFAPNPIRVAVRNLAFFFLPSKHPNHSWCISQIRYDIFCPVPSHGIVHGPEAKKLALADNARNLSSPLFSAAPSHQLSLFYASHQAS